MKMVKKTGAMIISIMLLLTIVPLQAFAEVQGPKVVNMAIIASNKGSDTTQKIHLKLTYDKNIKVLSGANKEISVALNGKEYGAERVSMSVDSNDKKKLNIDIDLEYALYAGKLTVKAKEITKVLGESDSNPIVWKNIDCYVPNGFDLKTISSISGDGSKGVKASVVKQISSLGKIRGMVHIQFLKNGIPVPGGIKERGDSVVTHYHNFLTITAKDYAATIAKTLTETYGTNYTFISEGDKITAESKKVENGEVLNIRVFAYPNDKDGEGGVEQEKPEVEKPEVEKPEAETPIEPERPQPEKPIQPESFVKELIDAETKVRLQGKFPTGYNFKASKIEDIKEVQSEISGFDSSTKEYKILLSYDMNLLNFNNAKVQPDSSVKVLIPLTSQLKNKTLYVYYVDSDGYFDKVDSEISGNNLAFTTNHFSQYIVVEEKDKTKNLVATNGNLESKVNNANNEIEESVNVEEKIRNPKTGDNSNDYTGYMVVSLILATTLVLIMNKKKKGIG